MNSEERVMDQLQAFQETTARLRKEIQRVVVGQEEIVEGVLTCLLAGSHVLLEGVPGLGKTLLVRSLAEALGLGFSRIQFTPDLMPADILGTTVVSEGEQGERRFEFKKGPIFSPVVLADEINRATPKTQSALLEAMQERRVTWGTTTYELGQPYFVLATQNPLEMEGTYPLPEAQLDRFFFQLNVPFPSQEELLEILERTTSGQETQVEPVLTREEILRLQRLVREVPAPRFVQEYVVRLVRASHPHLEGATEKVQRFIRTGSSPRGAQALLLASKIRALFQGRITASIDDVREVARPALRHRLLLNFEGEAEGVTTDSVIDQLVEQLAEVDASPGK